MDRNDPAQLEAGRAVLLQHLDEAHATEHALVTNLRAHIAMTPRGSYRESLERHLEETQQQQRALARRIREVGRDRGVLHAAYGVLTTAVGQAIVLTKGPLDLLRGGASGEQKLLKNARDEVASEALEIAIYDALEALATALGDEPTAKLAARHRAQEERMLAELRAHIPRLGHAVVQLKAAIAYERANRKRATVIERAQSLQEREPFAGYDELTAREIAQRLPDAGEPTAQKVREYEGRHQRRVEVLEAAPRQLSGSSS